MCKLAEKSKRAYYRSIDIKIGSDNRNIWKNIKPFFSEKHKKLSKVILVGKDGIISKDTHIAEIFNNFYLESGAYDQTSADNEEDKHPEMLNILENILKYYENHPSVLKIMEFVKFGNKFSFRSTTPYETESGTTSLGPSKTFPLNDIPVKVLKECKDLISPFLSDIYNKSITLSNFPNSLKLAEVTPAYKKDGTIYKKNYRPTSILPSLSKIFERHLYSQIYRYVEPFLSPHLCGFRKGFNTQDCLIVLIEKWEGHLTKKKKLVQF